MDLGTAKPTPAERARVPHHLIDILPLAEPMNVSRYVELAQAAAAAIRSRGRPVLVVGGSGFYLKAFFAAVTDAVPVPPPCARRWPPAWPRPVCPPSWRNCAASIRMPGESGRGHPRRVARGLGALPGLGPAARELAEEFARQPAALPAGNGS